MDRVRQGIELKKSECFELLNNLGLTDWILDQPEESLSIFLDGFFDYHFDEKTCYDFMPYTPVESVSNYFKECWEINWLEALNGKFYEGVEINIDSIAMSISDSETAMLREEIESHVLNWASEWCGNIKSALAKSVSESA